VLSSTSYKSKVEAAEKMFYKPKLWSVITWQTAPLVLYY
jgi:hypothetical protein